MFRALWQVCVCDFTALFLIGVLLGPERASQGRYTRIFLVVINFHREVFYVKDSLVRASAAKDFPVSNKTGVTFPSFIIS